MADSLSGFLPSFHLSPMSSKRLQTSTFSLGLLNMNSISLGILFFGFTSITHEALGQSCNADFKSKGCYKDFRGNRVLPELLMNVRGSKNFWPNYTNVLPSLICDCAAKAKDKRYRFFGIQFFGECWGGKTLPLKLRKRKTCKDVSLNPCAKRGSDPICTGVQWTNFIYKLPEAVPSTPGLTGKARIAKLVTSEATTGKPATAKSTTAPSTAKPTTAAPTKPKFTIKCTKPLDLAFVVDASGSVGFRSFRLVKTFLKEFTHYFNVSWNDTHFACLHYDHRVHKDFSFNDTQYYNSSALDTKLDCMAYPSGATLTDRALWEAKWFFIPNNGARDYHDIPRCIVVLTDGRTYGGRQRLILPSNALKKSAHVKIVAIGVGGQVDVEELKIMGGHRHYVLVDRFEDLADSMGEVLDKVCT